MNPTEKNPDKPENRITLYHDGECPLCRFEVKTMKRLDTRQAIHWVDITTEKAALEKAGIDYQQAMARIHVQDENRNIVTGVRGFMLVWKNLPYYRRLAQIIEKAPILLPVLEFFYTQFAKVRPLFNRKHKTG